MLFLSFANAFHRLIFVVQESKRSMAKEKKEKKNKEKGTQKALAVSFSYNALTYSNSINIYQIMKLYLRKSEKKCIAIGN